MTANSNNTANGKLLNNNNNHIANLNLKTSSSNLNGQLPNNNVSKLIGPYKNNHVVTTRNISVPLPLPNQDSDFKMQDHFKDRNNSINGIVNIVLVGFLNQKLFLFHKDIRKKNSAAADPVVSELTSIDMDDLIHLLGPLTEDAVMKTLQARFIEKKYFVSGVKTKLL